MKLELKLFEKVLKEISLEPEREYFLGRSGECDIVLEEELSLSRKHLRIYQPAGSKSWNIESLTEKSEVYFNGKEVTHFEIQGPCFFNLKNYVLSFLDDKTEVTRAASEEAIDKISAPPIKEDKQNQSHLEEGTQIISNTHLLYCLRILIEGEFSDYINLNLGGKWTIGRSEDCDVSINYDLLTRQHLVIEKKEDCFYVKDLGSTNKTYLNGSELSPNKSVLLNVDDEISVSDLKIIFEIRDTSYENKIQKLSTLLNTEETEDSLSEIVTPKLVLEDFVEEGSEKNFKNIFRKKLIFVLALFLLSGAGSYLFYEDTKSKKQQAMNQEENIKNKDLEYSMIYEIAQNNLRAGNYFECISNILELHNKVGGIGFYEDSKQIQNECQTGLDLMAQKKAEEEAEKKRLETEAKVKRIEEECEDQYNKGLIKTLSEINECAKELFDLDPNNAKISQIKMSIEEAELQRKLAEEKKEDYRKWIQSKRSLYYRAKKIDKEKTALKAVVAYDRFLKTARGVSALKSLYKQAEEERNAIQNSYDSTLKSLRDSCLALTENRKFKQAYPSCKRVLQFKNHDKIALSQIEKIKQELNLDLKPIYEQAQWHESFSRIEEAFNIWEEILERDIEGGYYYKKALSQIKKYQ